MADKSHGITTEKALRLGVCELVALAAFAGMWEVAEKRIGHNEPFDARIIRIGLKRGPALFSPEYADRWKTAQAACTLQMAKPICQLPPTEKMRKAGFNDYKAPKLEEAYRHFFGREMVGAHNAMADVQATMAVYWAIKDGIDLTAHPEQRVNMPAAEGA